MTGLPFVDNSPCRRFLHLCPSFCACLYLFPTQALRLLFYSHPLLYPDPTKLQHHTTTFLHTCADILLTCYHHYLVHSHFPTFNSVVNSPLFPIWWFFFYTLASCLCGDLAFPTHTRTPTHTPHTQHFAFTHTTPYYLQVLLTFFFYHWLANCYFA